MDAIIGKYLMLYKGSRQRQLIYNQHIAQPVRQRTVVTEPAMSQQESKLRLHSTPAMNGAAVVCSEESAVENDHFMSEGGVEFAGKHYLVDFWGAQSLTSVAVIEQALRDAAIASRSVLLHIHLHQFSSSGGVTGVALLAESHISVHTWPERNFAAFDVFMCGDAKPEEAVQLLKTVFQPERVELSEILRGKSK